MTLTLHIDRLCLRGRHGCLPQEATVGANFYYTLTATVRATPEVLRDDDLHGTVSYAALADIIGRDNEQPAQLLEHLAYRTLTHILRAFPLITEAMLRIDKENPPMGSLADSVGVSLSMRSDEA